MNKHLRKTALFLTIGLLLLLLCSCFILYIRYNDTASGYTAYIYQNNTLLQTIDLTQVTEEYTIPLSTENGGTNLIHVQPNGIAVTDANCPDKVCVHQGVIHNSLLPITCLPHGLVIELKPNRQTIDTITY